MCDFIEHLPRETDLRDPIRIAAGDSPPLRKRSGGLFATCLQIKGCLHGALFLEPPLFSRRIGGRYEQKRKTNLESSIETVANELAAVPRR
jgi:hypothetical protein